MEDCYFATYYEPTARCCREMIPITFLDKILSKISNMENWFGELSSRHFVRMGKTRQFRALPPNLSGGLLLFSVLPAIPRLRHATEQRWGCPRLPKERILVIHPRRGQQ